MIKKKIIKNTRFLGLTLCIYILLGLLTFADDLHIEIYSGELLLEPVDAVPYLNEDGRTMVPVRFISESFGASVAWDDNTQTVTITKSKSQVAFQVDSKLVRVNGQDQVMDTKMILDSESNRTFVPLRFAVEPLGISIENVEFLDEGMLKIELENSPSILNLRLGATSKEVVQKFGQPSSKGMSAYGYEWWFYADDYKRYLQVGIAGGEVVSIYTNNDVWQYQGTYPGMTAQALIDHMGIEDPVVTDFDNVSLKIKQDSSQERYLHVMGDVALEWFIDLHDGGVSSIRVSKMPYILTQSSHAFNYSFFDGSKPDYSPPTLTADQQLQVDETNSKMIYYLTNVSRVKRGLSVLTLEPRISSLSLSHSVDMQVNDFFDHTSPYTGSLGDRFKAWDIPFRSIMENIAYGQADGVYAHQGLMNSLGHRKNILHSAPTHIGVGSYFKYYTINFQQAFED